LDLPSGTYDLNYTLVTYVLPDKKLTEKMKQYMADHMKLRLDDKPGMLMTEKSTPVTGEWKHKGVDLIKFTVRDTQSMYIPISQQQKAVRLYPFERYELQARFEFDGIWIPQGLEPESKAMQLRFNVYHQRDAKNGFHRGSRKDLATDRLPEYRVEFAARTCWGLTTPSKQNCTPVITFAVPVARISSNVVWTTIFPMMATQALLVLIHTVETNISVGDIATIMLALFAFLTSARDKVPVFPAASVLDTLVFCFVMQLIFACADVLYEYVYPQDSAQNRPIFLIISTIFFGLQTVYVLFCWARAVYVKRGADDVKRDDVKREADDAAADKPIIAEDFNPDDWVLAGPKKLEKAQQAS